MVYSRYIRDPVPTDTVSRIYRLYTRYGVGRHRIFLLLLSSLLASAMRGDTASPAAHIPGAGSPSAYVYMVHIPCLDEEVLSLTFTGDLFQGSRRGRAMAPGNRGSVHQSRRALRRCLKPTSEHRIARRSFTCPHPPWLKKPDTEI